MRNAPVSEKAPVGVFVGLATLDVIHRIAKAPAVNQKITSTAQFVAAGGPAANAAVTFAALGGDAILVTALGDDPVADLIRADLAAYGVSVVDAAAGTTRAVPVSAVSVVESTGDRSVVSLDAVNSDASPPGDLADLVADADVVLVDGHHPLIARAAVRLAAARDTTLVVDAGRWKPVMSDIIPYATDMVCSNDFRMPGADDAESTAAALVRSGVRTVVTTHGGDPVEWWSDWRVRVRSRAAGGGGRHAGRRRCLPRRVLVLLDPDRERCRRAHRSLGPRCGTAVFGGRAAGMAERAPHRTDRKRER